MCKEALEMVKSSFKEYSQYLEISCKDNAIEVIFITDWKDKIACLMAIETIVFGVMSLYRKGIPIQLNMSADQGPMKEILELTFKNIMEKQKTYGDSDDELIKLILDEFSPAYAFIAEP